MPTSPAAGSPSRNHTTAHGAEADSAAASGSSRLPTCTSSPDWFAKIRAFADAYAAKEP